MIAETIPSDAGAITLWGHPWHGLWKAGDNKIHVPGGPAIDTPGQQPAHGPLALESHIGDAYMVQPPGTPPVTRDPAAAADDAAAGRTWLDYGILSGSRKRLYGVPLHGNDFDSMRAWIYVSQDGRRWLVRAGIANLIVTQYGHFAEDTGAQAVSQTINISLGMIVPYTNQHLFALEDVVPAGDRALLVFASLESFPGEDARRLYQVWEIALSGVPPMMSATVTEHYRLDMSAENGDHEYTTISASIEQFGRRRFAVYQLDPYALIGYQVFDYNGAPDYNTFVASLPPGQTADQGFDWLVSTVGSSVREIATPYGAAFVGGVASIIKLVQRLEQTTSATIDETALLAGEERVGFSITTTQGWSTTLRLHDGAPAITSSAAGVFERTGLHGPTAATPPIVTNEAWSSSATIDGVSIPEATAFAYVGSGVVSGFRYRAKRLGSGCWSLVARNGNGDDLPMAKAIGHFHRGVVGHLSALPMARSLPSAATDLHGFASAHPVTGEIAWDAAEALCWV